jgi:hypothetical protein
MTGPGGTAAGTGDVAVSQAMTTIPPAISNLAAQAFTRLLARVADVGKTV